MDLRKIKKLIELIDETGVAEIEIREGEESVRINRYAGASHTQMIMPPMQGYTPHPYYPPNIETKAAEVPVVAEKPHLGHAIKAPMVGTVYLSPAPGSDAFVTVGKTVKIGDVLCLIEAMKMFNQIQSDKAGVIKVITVDNEQPVEFDQPLFIIE
ncbi:acetyl-CoA carboxylase biotin carboxyl carrier protein [soil metagenome]